MSQKEQLAEWRAARADTRQKRETMRQARTDYEAAKKHYEGLCDDMEEGQGRLALKRPDDEPKSEAS